MIIKTGSRVCIISNAEAVDYLIPDSLEGQDLAAGGPDPGNSWRWQSSSGGRRHFRISRS
jgi:hypothetical protein